MRPLISIVVPVYNAGPHLEPCLKSLLAQTYRPLEILLVDDHSTDGSSEICQRWAEEQQRYLNIYQQFYSLPSAAKVNL